MNASTSRSQASLRLIVPLLVALVTIAALLPSTAIRWGADDSYVLEHLQSPEWRTRLFAFNLDRPSEHAGAWWDGIVYQRRFVRVLPSALMALEVRVFGQDPFPLHLVSLILHVFSTLLVFHLAKRWLGGPARAALVAMLFGVHPVSVEVVGWFACQPLLVATVCTLLATEWWIRFRETGRAAWLGAAVVTVLAAVTSYEAAIAGPVLLVVGDMFLYRGADSRRRAWMPRLALLSVLVPFAMLSIWNSSSAVALETSVRPDLASIWKVARTDLAAYLFKALGLVRPGAPTAYWIHNAVGEPVALLLLLTLLAPLAWLARRQPLALLGLLAFAAFLTPPWLMRATVSALNQPSLRQVYLPLMGLAAVLTAALYCVRFRTALMLTLPLIIAMTILDRQPRRGPGTGGADSARVPTARALTNSQANVPVIVAGSFDPVLDRAGCAYDVSLTWPGRSQLNLVPPTVSGATPQLVRAGERSFTARSDERGFAIAAHRTPPAVRANFSAGGVRLTPAAPPLLREGHQQVGEARIEVVERDAEVVRGLRYTLEQPLYHYAFIAVDGCAKVSPLRLD